MWCQCRSSISAGDAAAVAAAAAAAASAAAAKHPVQKAAWHCPTALLIDSIDVGTRDIYTRWYLVRVFYRFTAGYRTVRGVQECTVVGRCRGWRHALQRPRRPDRPNGVIFLRFLRRCTIRLPSQGSAKTAPISISFRSMRIKSNWFTRVLSISHKRVVNWLFT